MKKLYIVAEATSTSGGPETIHQLAGMLKNQYNLAAYLYYIDINASIVPDKFKKYNVMVTRTIEDNESNMLIVPESYTDFLTKYRKIRKCILWLSLDFYLNTLPWNRTKLTCKLWHIPFILSPLMYIILQITHRLRHNVYTFKNSKKDNIMHLYNCEYVYDFLLSKGVNHNNMIYLCGPLRDEFLDAKVNLDNKKNIIIYNPKKGIKFTNKVIEKCRDLDYTFIPIQGITPKEIVKLMEKAKLYIDFGYFPGPERIPREACMMYCNIITSNIGSATNNKDVLVPYKFSLDTRNLNEIKKLIIELVENYKVHITEYDEYRKKITNQKKLFVDSCKRVAKIFEG